MKYSKDTERVKLDLERQLTDLVKKRIVDLGLVNSGTMLNESRVTLDYTSNGIDINFISTDYFKYVNDKYDIINYVIRDKKIDDQITDLFGLMVIDFIMLD